MNSIEENTDFIILPEIFTTGLSMESTKHAETMEGKSVRWIRKMAAEQNAAIMGCIIIRDDSNYYNRLIWVNPDGSNYIYDKRHLFDMYNEDKRYSDGNNGLIVNYKGWKIYPMVYYDLRFPVWSRNVNMEYDLLIYIASWPNQRSYDWNTLLRARAIENQSYVIGVNRVGTDGYGHEYNGDSCLIDPGWRKTLFHQEKKDII